MNDKHHDLYDSRLRERIQKIVKDSSEENKYLLDMSEKKLACIKPPGEKFKEKVVLCRLTNIYDGDTANIVFVNEGKLECFRFRIYGYDSPEMKVPVKWSKEKRERKKLEAIKAKNELIEFTSGKKLIANIIGKDKYGRLIGNLYAFPDIYDDSDDFKKYDVCHHMISSGHGYIYKGGKKR